MRVELTSIIPRNPEWVWERVKRSDTLHFIAHPLIRFRPKAGRFPEIWTEGEYEAGMSQFGVLPIGSQVIGIEYPQGKDGYVLRDNGRGTLIRLWDHWIFVEPDGQGGTRYTDRVDVKAGLLTPLIAGFARIFYGHRQRRWQSLAKRD